MLQDSLSNCNLCPRNCNANRINNELGYCYTNAEPLISSIVLHKGEEPVLSGNTGICNVFFAHCNLACSYCQNYQISNNNASLHGWHTNYDEIIQIIIKILNQGIRMLGFVSPMHQIPQMVEIIERLKEKKYSPTIIYNTNAYDKPEILRLISGYVDIYLPDFKYYSNQLAVRYSDAPNYLEIATSAIKEMVWQKGTSLTIGDDNLAESGVIIRHLILPEHSKDSILILKHLAGNISTNLFISLLSQYYPTNKACNLNQLQRTITTKEYFEVIKTFHDQGFYRGWQQDLTSNEDFRPNFLRKKPFLD